MQVPGFGVGHLVEGALDWWSKHTRLVSCYSPVEAAGVCLVGEILPGANPNVIGRPDGYGRLYLLNPRKQWVPHGAIGDIYLGGEQCGRGYFNRPDLSVEHFMLDVFSESPYAVMVRTGDRGRFLTDGSIEYLGRSE